MKNNLHILNTRPQHQSTALNNLIHAIGGDTFDLPLFDIQSLSFEKPSLTDFDYIIFLSSNAVNCFFAQQNEIFIPGKIIAIGSATLRALHNKNLNNVICPSHFSSEGILEMPFLQDLKNKSVLIICGENSKSLLSTEFSVRGARIKIITCYRRVPIKYDMNALFPELIKHKINTVIATSFESLQQLFHLFNAPAHRDWLIAKKLCVVTDKMKSEAIRTGFHTVIQASNATDQAIVTALDE